MSGPRRVGSHPGAESTPADLREFMDAGPQPVNALPSLNPSSEDMSGLPPGLNGPEDQQLASVQLNNPSERARGGIQIGANELRIPLPGQTAFMRLAQDLELNGLYIGAGATVGMNIEAVVKARWMQTRDRSGVWLFLVQTTRSGEWVRETPNPSIWEVVPGVI